MYKKSAWLSLCLFCAAVTLARKISAFFEFFCTYVLASAFHRFYGNCRIQGADPAVQQARLALCIGVKNVIFNVLTMFKINVPEKM